MLKEIIGRVVSGQDLSADEAATALGFIMDGSATPPLIAAFVTALRMKGETVEEITGCARAMRERAVRVDPGSGLVLDTCGTGGDGKGTFNVSTLTALVASACGARVAKHGNRAASSKCGSSDILEVLGVKIDNPADKAQKMLREIGFAYMHAPVYHPAMKHAGPIRKELGFRTVFNILGPLCNPAGPKAQALGVFSPDLCRPMAEVLQALGSTHVFTFHGHGGLDELSISGPNTVFELRDGKITESTLAPGDVGLGVSKLEELVGGSPEDNARIAREILDGKAGPPRDAVVLNTAVALVAAELVSSPKEGAEKARQALDSGAARKKLEVIARASQ